MSTFVGVSPGHRALALVRDLVQAFDRHPQAVRFAAAVPELRVLEQRARAILEVQGEPRTLPPAQAPELYRWCRECHAQHVFVEDRRQGPRSSDAVGRAVRS
jgi:hypothetical protein